MRNIETYNVRDLNDIKKEENIRRFIEKENWDL